MKTKDTLHLFNTETGELVKFYPIEADDIAIELAAADMGLDSSDVAHALEEHGKCDIEGRHLRWGAPTPHEVETAYDKLLNNIEAAVWGNAYTLALRDFDLLALITLGHEVVAVNAEKWRKDRATEKEFTTNTYNAILDIIDIKIEDSFTMLAEKIKEYKQTNPKDAEALSVRMAIGATKWPRRSEVAEKLLDYLFNDGPGKDPIGDYHGRNE